MHLSRHLTVLVAIAISTSSTSALAEAREVSTRVYVIGSATRVSVQDGDTSLAYIAPVLGAGVRVIYASGETYTHDIGVTWQRVPIRARFTLSQGRYNLYTALWLRGESGISANWGTAWRSTARFAVGLQRQTDRIWRARDPLVIYDGEQHTWQPVVSVAYGLERRWGKSWAAGGELGGRHWISLSGRQSGEVTGTLYLGCYWYL